MEAAGCDIGNYFAIFLPQKAEGVDVSGRCYVAIDYGWQSNELGVCDGVVVFCLESFRQRVDGV